MYTLNMDGVWNVWIMYELCCIYLLVPLKLKNHFPAGRPPEEMLANFFFMDYGLIMYELCMDYVWSIYGLCMDYV